MSLGPAATSVCNENANLKLVYIVITVRRIYKYYTKPYTVKTRHCVTLAYSPRKSVIRSSLLHIFRFSATLDIPPQIAVNKKSLSSLLHRVFRRISFIINQQMHYTKFRINPLALELDIHSLAHHLCTIYVKCEYFMNQEG